LLGKPLDCFSEVFGEDGMLGRDNRSEVILVRELREALIKINPACTIKKLRKNVLYAL